MTFGIHSLLIAQSSRFSLSMRILSSQLCCRAASFSEWKAAAWQPGQCIPILKNTSTARGYFSGSAFTVIPGVIDRDESIMEAE